MVEGQRVLCSSIIIKLIKDVVDINIVDLIRFEELNYFYSQMGFVFLFYTCITFTCLRNYITFIPR